MEKYTIGTKENLSFLVAEQSELLEFGKNFLWPTGGAAYLDKEGNPDIAKGLDAYESGRYAHSYALGFLLGLPSSSLAEDLSGRSLTAFTSGELRDKHYGGWYTHLNSDGSHDPGKDCYAHAFVILGAASASQISIAGSDHLLNESLSVYDTYFWDSSAQMPIDTYCDDQFQEVDTYRGLNSAMHSVEAFLAAYDATGKQVWRERAGLIIDRVISLASDNRWRIPEHFDQDWNPLLEYNKDHKADRFKPYGTTPGHSLEWARLICQWSLSTYPHQPELRQRYLSAACNLFDQAVADAWCVDGADGLVYTIDNDGQPVVHDRMHWTLAEGINTAWYLYRLTDDQTYESWYERFWAYTDRYLIDHRHGSWFHQLDAKNQVSGTIWPGKPDIYHALQASIIPTFNEIEIDQLGLSILPLLSRSLNAR